MQLLLDTLRSTSFVDFIEYLGTTVFAISGIRLAAAKNFDWFGALVIGFVTAIGGGTVRDLFLRETPFWMLNPIYIYCTVVGLVIVIIFSKKLVRLDTPFFIFDSIGLALFVVVGIEKTLALNFPFWVAIVNGTITGVVGGIIRDVFINEIPLIFRKEFYALACIFGGIIYMLCDKLHCSLIMCEIITVFFIFILRMLAVHFQWGLPRLNIEPNKTK